jgi:STE24 endopeptidase
MKRGVLSTCVLSFLMTLLLTLSSMAAQAQVGPPDKTTAAVSAQPVASVAPRVAAAFAAASSPSSWFSIQPADEAWQGQLPLNAEAATQAYLDRLPPAVKARSDAYFEGGYWLQLWHLLLGVAVAALWLTGRRSVRLRDWASRVGRGALRRDFLFSSVYLGVATLISLPLTAYEEWWRERAYGMGTQTLGAWLLEWLLAGSINLLLGAVAFTLLYVLMRRARSYWWAWGAAGAMAMLALLIAINPVVFAPMFNTYKPVEAGPLKDSILRMAHATGVPADDVLVFDASRQTTKVSAHVAGLGGTVSIRLNDNLLRRTSPAEVRAVMGHEIGHYVLNHIPKMLIMMGILVVVAFLTADGVLKRVVRRLSAKAGASGGGDVSDIAWLPLLACTLSVFFALTSPITNTIIRVQEAEADQFGLALSREPLAFAEGQLMLVEYRKADPGALEEMWFFDHPSTRSRILAAMRFREAMGGQ